MLPLPSVKILPTCCKTPPVAAHILSLASIKTCFISSIGTKFPSASKIGICIEVPLISKPTGILRSSVMPSHGSKVTAMGPLRLSIMPSLMSSKRSPTDVGGPEVPNTTSFTVSDSSPKASLISGQNVSICSSVRSSKFTVPSGLSTSGVLMRPIMSSSVPLMEPFVPPKMSLTSSVVGFLPSSA